MNICFICKYPPIQGGVSMHGYWAARGLASRGHKVYVVTNADEVEDTFRIRIPEEDRAPGGEYARAFPETGGLVEVHSTEPPDRRKLYYIPMGNPTVSRLATKAADIIRKHDCEVIFSYYMEPYGMAAFLASAWTGVPYVFKHAGSDLNRLMPCDDLTTGYLEVMARANRLITRGASRQKLASYGIGEDRMDSSVAFGLPRACFNAEREPLDLDALLAQRREELDAGDPERDFLRPLDPDLPILGIYGKMGEPKGSFDLVHAVASLVESGFPLQVVALSRGWQEQRFRRLGDELGIREHLRILPFIPHWQVPAFIRACDALAFLERDFAIAAHTPTIPLEILSCGACLVLSEEVARKQLFRAQIRDRGNLIVVSDPKDHDELAACIRHALEDRERAARIGAAGRELAEDVPSYEKYVESLEALLVTVAGERPFSSCLGAGTTRPEAPIDPVEMVSRLFPYTHALLSPALHEALREDVRGSALGDDASDRVELALRLGERMEKALRAAQGGETSLVEEVCRYETGLHRWSRLSDESARTMRLPRLGTFPSDARGLIPVLQGGWEVQRFAYDVETLVQHLEKDGFEREAVDEAALQGEIYVLFHQGSIPMRISEATAILLSLMDGRELTTDQIVDELAELSSNGAGLAPERLWPGVLSLMEGLYWEGALRFQGQEAR